MLYDRDGRLIEVGDEVMRIASNRFLCTNNPTLRAGHSGTVTGFSLNRVRLSNSDSDHHPLRLRIIKKGKSNMATKTIVRKFWMVASDNGLAERFDHNKFRQFGGAPYKKYYSQSEAISAIASMTRDSGKSYYLLEAVEHHAPAAATQKTEL